MSLKYKHVKHNFPQNFKIHPLELTAKFAMISLYVDLL